MTTAAFVAVAANVAVAQEEPCLLLSCAGNTTITPGGGAQGPSVLVVENGGGSYTPSNVPAWVLTCRYELVTAYEVALLGPSPFGSPSPTPTPGWDPDAPWVAVTCPDHPLWGATLYDLYPLGDPPPPTVQLLVAAAYDATSLPALRPNAAPDGTDSAPLISQLPTWLWLDQTRWGPVSATASVPGASATVTARPAPLVTWTGSDLGPTICSGPGTPYTFGLGEDGQHSDCTMVFDHSSVVRDYVLGAEVTWDYTVSCNPSWLCGGSLPSATVQSTRPVRVHEIQALLTVND